MLEEYRWHHKLVPWRLFSPIKWPKWHQIKIQLKFNYFHWWFLMSLILQLVWKLQTKLGLVIPRNSNKKSIDKTLNPLHGTQWRDVQKRIQISIFLMLKLEHYRQIRSIPGLLMLWLLASPGHQQPWYRLCRINRSLFSMGKNSNYLILISSNERICKYSFMFPKIKFNKPRISTYSSAQVSCCTFHPPAEVWLLTVPTHKTQSSLPLIYSDLAGIIAIHSENYQWLKFTITDEEQELDVSAYHVI